MCDAHSHERSRSAAGVPPGRDRPLASYECAYCGRITRRRAVPLDGMVTNGAPIVGDDKA